LLFAANGETFDSLQAHVKTLQVNATSIQTRDIDGLLKTKADYREKDALDKQALRELKAQL
jgi:hypothetical protein